MNAVSRWRTYPQLGRVSNLPTIATQTAAAIAIAGAAPDALDVLAIGAGLALAYTAGMFLNDAFDRDFDSRERPNRPIPSGRIDAHEVFAAGGALLLTGGALVVLAGARHGHGAHTLLFTLALAAAIVLYDARHKGRPFAPLVMGACRGLVYLCVAAALAPAQLPMLSFVAAGVMTVYVTGLSLVARRAGSERITVALLAGMSLIDATFLAATGHLALAGVAAGAVPITRALQHVVRGT